MYLFSEPCLAIAFKGEVHGISDPVGNELLIVHPSLVCRAYAVVLMGSPFWTDPIDHFLLSCSFFAFLGFYALDLQNTLR